MEEWHGPCDKNEGTAHREDLMLATILFGLALSGSAHALELEPPTPAEPAPPERFLDASPTPAPSGLDTRLAHRSLMRREARPGLSYLAGLGGAVAGTGAGLLVSLPVLWADGPQQVLVVIPAATVAGAALGVHLFSDAYYPWELLGAGVGAISSIPVFAVMLAGAMLPNQSDSELVGGILYLGIPMAAYYGLTTLGAWTASRIADGTRRSAVLSPSLLPGEDGEALPALTLGMRF
jgi:multisubunit Na+/H+ antiporter MnhG subunit